MPVQRLPSAADIAAKMLDRSRTAGDAWVKGTTNPSKSPTEQMKKAGKAYDNAMTAALSKQLWQKAVAKLTDQDIFSVAEKVGGAAWSSGITNREDKIKKAFELLVPKLEQHLRKIDGMPTDTPEQREAKMVANLRGMREIGLS